jgi:hypothetical protein
MAALNAFPDSIAPRGDDASLWSWALGVSLMLHLALLAGFGMLSLRPEWFGPAARPAPAPVETLTVILPPPRSPMPPPAIPKAVPAVPQVSTPAPTAGTPPRETPRFARTSEEQASARPERPSFIGERNTIAASERSPVSGALPLPSQAGIQPRNPAHLETTESTYQDGSLEPAGSPEATRAKDPPSAPDPSGSAATATEPAPPSKPRETLLQSPFPVDVPVPMPKATAAPSASLPVQETPRQKETDSSTRPKERPSSADASQSAKERPFRGFQRKTAVMGSISRSGPSALDVEDSPLGRYQAAVSRAVELEWQRNCARHRDFITPGFLTVRFFVDQGGRVRSVEFVGDMKTGEVQKGFTLNAIRDANLPAMPSVLRREYDSEPLELVFRFYF